MSFQSDIKKAYYLFCLLEPDEDHEMQLKALKKQITQHLHMSMEVKMVV